jgi:hypothetical protein
MDCSVIITANGSGERMKAITDSPKFSLYYGNKRILEHLLIIFPTAKVLTHYSIPYIDQFKIIKCKPTKSRKETLENLKGMKNVLIVDCDILVENMSFAFIQKDILCKKGNVNSGLYYFAHMDKALAKMQGDAIETGMNNPLIHPLETIHLGTPEEYYNAIL